MTPSPLSPTAIPASAIRTRSWSLPARDSQPAAGDLPMRRPSERRSCIVPSIDRYNLTLHSPGYGSILSHSTVTRLE